MKDMETKNTKSIWSSEPFAIVEKVMKLMKFWLHLPGKNTMACMPSWKDHMLPRETHTSIMKLIRLQLCPRRDGSTNETNTRSKKQITKSEFYQLVQAEKKSWSELFSFAKFC